MQILLPNFHEYVDFRELSPVEGNNIYRYITLKPIIVKCVGLVPKNVKISCRDGNGKEWLYIDSKHFIILKGYAWNGCSPKRYVPIFGWIGTIDFEKTILASLIHDAFIQFCKVKNFPLSRKECDNLFHDVLLIEKFQYHNIYYIGASLGTITNISPPSKNLKVILTYSDNRLNNNT